MTFSTKELRANAVAEPVLVARALRRKHRLSQRELAAMIGIDLTHLKKVEVGKRPLGPKTQEKLEAWAKRWEKFAVLEL